MKNLLKSWRNDLPAGLVVFLVALPLCLGVGLASTKVQGIEGMPNIFAGIIAGVVGGLVVGFFSGSRLGVSGPAAGLITIVSASIITLGSFESFLLAVMISGVIQLIAGFIGAGVIGNYFPSAVIKGMLASIGIMLILKEIPHALGYDADFMGDEAFFQTDGHNTFSELLYAVNALHPGAIFISIGALFILILFERPYFKKKQIFKIIPGALIAVIFGIVGNVVLTSFSSTFEITGKHLVTLPVAKSIMEFTSFFSFPDFSAWNDPNVYIIAFTIALVGSLETLLSVEATDKMDPDKNLTPTNKELRAQGIGNFFSGLIGGLPLTQVIVRSSANINSNAKSKLSTLFHGLLLLLSVMFIPQILNLIPLSALAAILIMIGYKLAKVELFKNLYKAGWDQFIPFVSTIVGVLLTDLLKGIAIGMAVSIFFILKRNYRNNYNIKDENIDGKLTKKIILSEEVSFLNKGSILEQLASLEENSSVIIDGSKCHEIDYDVMELLQDFVHVTSKEKNIHVRTIQIPFAGN
jgi:MFS superfamily sulfate permease-like transporter